MEAFLADVAQSLPGVVIGYILTAVLVFGIKKAYKAFKKREADMWRKHKQVQMANNHQNLRRIGYMK